ncbi:hypothetical protein [Gordonia phthalatica]|uniref:hypothetical protein n=1 Tax=Gordonia phthalatica TaxID=1136941 RepID=UPI000781FB99|nr:hypothetical protein [Gordonia phthalatica]
MAGIDDFPDVTRRKIRDQRMKRRVESEMESIARRIQRRRVLAWAASDDGPYPEFADSVAEARAEVELLLVSLGPLVLLDPHQIDSDLSERSYFSDW